MSRPRNVHNPFDWKRSLIIDLYVIDGISGEQRDKLLRMVDDDELADRRQGQAESAARAERRQKQPWWKRWWSW